MVLTYLNVGCALGAHLTLILNKATAKTVRTFLIAETIAITASSFFLLPSSFFYNRLAVQQKAARNRLPIEKTVVELEEKTLN